MSVASDFFGPGNQFLLVNKSHRGRLGQNFFGFSTNFVCRLSNEMLKPPRNTKTQSDQNKK